MGFVFNPGPPEEAYTFWQDKVPMSKKAFNQLAEDERVKAFIVGGMARGDMLTAMHQSIDNALATGQSIKAWKKEVRELFTAKGWNQLQGFRLDNIFRTNIQTAYSVGRYRQMTRVKDSRPYWRYSAINDSRTRPTHAALHGRVVRADAPFWDMFYPPNGYRCRCTVTSLSDRDMKRKRLTAETIEPGKLLQIPAGPQKGMAVPVMPDNNFRDNPGKTYWKADTRRYRADVRQMVLKDFTRACPEEFCGPCEFAETDCFLRLKRHLTQVDLEDLQTVVWADQKTGGQSYEKWVSAAMKPSGDGGAYPVGNLPARVLRSIETQPRLSLVAIVGKQVAKMADRPGGSDAAEKLPDLLASSQWWQDRGNSSQLVTRIPTGNRWHRVTVELDHDAGERVVNQVVGTEMMAMDDASWGQKYEVL